MVICYISNKKLMQQQVNISEKNFLKWELVILLQIMLLLIIIIAWVETLRLIQSRMNFQGQTRDPKSELQVSKCLSQASFNWWIYAEKGFHRVSSYLRLWPLLSLQFTLIIYSVKLKHYPWICSCACVNSWRAS